MRNKLMILIVFVILLIPINIKAATINTSLICPTSANKGDTISCKLNVTSDVTINGVAAKYNLGSNFTYVSFTPNTSIGFSSNYTSATGFSVGNNNGKNGTFTIGVLKVKVNNPGSLSVTNFDISDTNFNSYTVANKTATIRLNSTNNNLEALSTNQGNIIFDKNTLNYNLNVESNITSITINASLEDKTSKFVNGYGPRTVNLKYGKNPIQIKVQAESSTIKTYTINVNRKDNRNTNNYLKSLTLSSGNINFNKNTLNYTMTVNYEINKINVQAVPEDQKAKVTINSPNLVVGNNTITIKVTSENEQVRIYKIVVQRLSQEIKKSDNNNVSSLKVLGHDLDFNQEKLEYDLNIKDEYALVFEISLEDAKASYKIEGNEDLKDGSVIKVLTTSESGKTKEYKFNINKEKEELKKDNSMLNIIFGAGGFLLGVGFTLIITKKKKINNTNPPTYNNTNMGNTNLYKY